MKNYNYQRPSLTNYQREILFCDERFTITEAATKCGKTHSHIAWLFEETLKLKDNQHTWWVAPVYAQAEIAYKRIKSSCEPKHIFKFNDTKLTIVFPSGSIMDFKTADKADNLYGEDVHAAVFDEFTRAKEESWYALRTTLTATKGKCKLIGNAKGKKNWGYKLGAKARSGEPGYRYFRITAYDAVEAGILDLEEVEQAKKDLPDHVFRELYLAEPNEDGSNPFGYEYIKNCLQEGLSSEPTSYIGIDLAKYTDWTVCIGLDKNGKITLFKRFRKDWEQTENEIMMLPDVPTYIDSSGVGDPIVERTSKKRRNISGVKYTTTSKPQLILGLATTIQKGQIGIIDGVLRDELESFEFVYHPKTAHVTYEAPLGMNDDCVNALALADKCRHEKKNLANFDYGFYGM